MDFFHQKNLELYKFLENTFHLKKCKTWDQVSSQITLDRVKQTFKFFSRLFPIDQNYSKYFSASNAFRTLHYGNLKGNKIINEIVRFSLYTEEILVFHPLQNPALTNPAISPIKNPKYWLDDFLSALHFYIVLKKWVETGIVKLVVNPVNYDFKLRDEFLKQAKIRVENFLSRNPDYSLDEVYESLAEQFTNEYGHRSIQWLKSMLLDLSTPKFTEEEAEKFAFKIKEAYPRRNPLYNKLRIPKGRSIVSEKQGANAEAITY